MKKLTVIFFAAAVIMCSLTTFAASGDIAGQYYGTDIVTYLNGAEIDSINIDGRTLISAEDMKYYSFYVDWIAEESMLRVGRLRGGDMEPPEVTRRGYDGGKPLGNYYETDIVTYLDFEPITAYNIGGRTYILAEQMRDFGYAVDWNETNKTLSITSPDRAGYEYTMYLSSGRSGDSENMFTDGAGAAALKYENGKLAGRGDADKFYTSLECDGKGYKLKLEFTANAGLHYSYGLQNILSSLMYDDRGETLAAPEDLYDAVNKNVSVIINGNKAEKVAVRKWGGNNHTDYILEFSDIPIYKESEIESVYLSVGNTDGMEEYEMEKTEY